MTEWAQGYVSDQPYTSGFYHFTTPNHLAFCTLFAGERSSCAAQPAHVLELGIGMGFGLLLTAAAYPRIQFEGMDFSPTHIAHARDLAASAGLTNVTVSEASFQEAAARAREQQADVDIIVLHGILTWIQADAQAAIVEIVRKRLRPGGLVMVSYNVLPGWAAISAFQRLLLDHARSLTGNSSERMRASMEFARSLIAGNASFFKSNPMVAEYVTTLENKPPAYLAHEFLNESSAPLYFADVCAMFGRAKLNYVCSTNLVENIDVFSAPATLRTALASEKDVLRKESLRDFASNKMFRRDIFVKGRNPLPGAEQRAAKAALRFARTEVQSDADTKVKTAFGPVPIAHQISGPILDLLDRGEADLGEITSLPALAGQSGGDVTTTIVLMVHAGLIMPITIDNDVSHEPAHRFNATIIRKARDERPYTYLAAPAVGSGVSVPPVDMLALGVIAEDPGCDAETIIERVCAFIEQRKAGAAPAGDSGTGGADTRARIRPDVTRFMNVKLPIWRRLGVV